MPTLPTPHIPDDVATPHGMVARAAEGGGVMMEGARGVERQHKREQRSRNVSDRRRIINSSTAAAAAAALSYVCLLGAASAADPGLPDGYKVVHANVVLRHGERSRLVKTTASEFGDNDGVVVSSKSGGVAETVVSVYACLHALYGCVYVILLLYSVYFMCAFTYV